jgi:hypothetical protein
VTGEVRDRRALELLALVAIAAVLVGVRMLDGTTITSSYQGALAGMIGQLRVTAPAALEVLGAAALQLAAGAVLMRFLRQAPYAGLADALLAGLVGAVAIELGLLFLLGGIGRFTQAPLLLANAAIVGAGWLTWPFFATRLRVRITTPSVGLLLIGFIWSGVVVLQLASPVVPFLDVLPNHVAPAEHLRTFGDLATLTVAPSPIYGPSRLFLGYTALMGGTATMTGLPASLSVAAFILPTTLLVAVGMVRLATAIHGPALAPWMLLTFMLTASFAHLADNRATVMVLPLVAFCLVELWESRVPKRPMVLAIGLATAVCLHPLMGAMTFATVAALVAVAPGRYAATGAPALLGAGLLALPQAATMLGFDLQPVVGLLPVPAAVAATWFLHRFDAARRVAVAVLQVGGTFALTALVVVSLPAIGSRAGELSDFVLRYPVLAWTLAVGLIVAGRRTLAPIPVLAFAIGFAGALAADAIPFEALGVQGVNYEVAKTLHFWIPVFLAVLAAFALQALWESPRYDLRLRSVVVGIFLLAAALPIRTEPITTEFLGEYRFSEVLSVELGHAETGYWRGYPDTRTLIDGEQAQLLDRLRNEIVAGRLTATTQVLHVAFDFQQWASTPLGVMAGVLETTASVQTEVSIHTAGGRLFPIDRLDGLLRGSYRYVVLEPADLPSSVRDRIVAAGYESLFANERAEIFVL